MERRLFITATLFILQLSSIVGGLNMRANYQAVTVREGEAVELACSADRELKQCSFTTAQGMYRPFYEGASFPRMKPIMNTNHQVCGIEVMPAELEGC